MPEMTDASTLKDDQRVRRGDLAARHTEALRLGDADELAAVEKEIQAEYADDPQPEPVAETEAAPAPKGRK